MALALGIALSGTFPAWGQTLALSSGATTEGSPVTLSLSLSGTSPIGTLQFSLSYSSNDFGSITVKPGGALTATGKMLSCSDTPGRTVCMAWGMSQTSFQSGEIADVTASPKLAAAAERRIELSAVGASPAGLQIPIKSTSGAVTVSTGGSPTLASLLCSSGSLRRGDTSVCTVKMTARVATNVKVALSSSSPILSAPPYVIIGPGQSSVSFVITAGNVIEKRTATLKASAGTQSTTTTLTVLSGAN